MKKLGAFALVACLTVTAGIGSAEDFPTGEWVRIFNGENLDGWTPKFAGSALGENYRNTFRVEDGLLTASYDEYETFDDEFGHLYYEKKFSRYRMRVEYRFLGEQTPNAPRWALMNSGIMFHTQDPATIRKDQPFPVCVEAQMLGDDGERTTGNLCSPGTHVMIDGKLVTEHCLSTSKVTTPLGEWTRFEIEVHGGDLIRHLVNGEVVAEYSHPTLDDTDADAKALIEAGAPLELTEGYVALQAESHRVQFRNVEVMILEE